MFTRANAYDRYMGRWSRMLAARFVDFAEVAESDEVLDVGCGTGALSLAIRAARKGTRVRGVDPAADFVDEAKRRGAGDEQVRFDVGNAQELDLPDASFDKALSSLVLNFVPEPKRALAEMIRVTKPGGLLAATAWDYRDGMKMLNVFWDEAIANDPALASRNESNMPLCRQGALVELWKGAGLTGATEEALELTLGFSSFEDYWEPFKLGQGPAGAIVASMPADKLAALEARLRKRLLGDRGDGPFELPARAWAVKARKR